LAQGVSLPVSADHLQKVFSTTVQFLRKPSMGYSSP
jgi:hypothetical protein